MNREIRRRQKRLARKDIPHEPRRGGSAPGTSGRRRSSWIVVGALMGVALVAAAVFLAWQLRGGTERPGEAITTCSTETGGEDPYRGICRRHLDTGGPYEQYSTDPPTSGPHADSPADWGVYRPDMVPFPTREQLVHNMEHGGVIIWYRPDALNEGQLDELTREVASMLKDRRKKVVLYPYTSMEAPITLTSWAWMQKLDAYDLEAIRVFVDGLESQTAPDEERNMPLSGRIILPPGYE